jgi:hypothetical protein
MCTHSTAAGWYCAEGTCSTCYLTLTVSRSTGYKLQLYVFRVLPAYQTHPALLHLVRYYGVSVQQVTAVLGLWCCRAGASVHMHRICPPKRRCKGGQYTAICGLHAWRACCGFDGCQLCTYMRTGCRVHVLLITWPLCAAQQLLTALDCMTVFFFHAVWMPKEVSRVASLACGCCLSSMQPCALFTAAGFLVSAWLVCVLVT